MLSTSFF